MSTTVFEEKTIFFYGDTDEYFEFSNFYMRTVKIDDTSWPSTEHYYQAQKFKYAADQGRIRHTISADMAFYLGRNLDAVRVSNWDSIKVDIMRIALHHKFKQNPDLSNLLISTDNAIIKEKSIVDSFWGIGCDKQGSNMLGILLMEIRSKI